MLCSGIFKSLLTYKKTVCWDRTYKINRNELIEAVSRFHIADKLHLKPNVYWYQAFKDKIKHCNFIQTVSSSRFMAKVTSKAQ